MPKLVCTKCECELYPKKNGVFVVETASGEFYKLWRADLWVCNKCGSDVITGFGDRPVIQDFEDPNGSRLETCLNSGDPVYYNNCK